ncbi:UDP-N-acetylglucosamine 2-epimerase [Halodesulfovibrio aestuarii]|uniref:UDP-N-acetylglucosamine 2-epimerase n=1 Tax=Halodesulfovibrio aestuarii TaxID=126333 RepID=A0ABV4JWD9_9BACT
MTNKRRVCVVVTARPSYARIKTALQAIEKHPDLELFLVVGGSALIERYGNAADVIQSDGFTISARAYSLVEGENLTSMAKTTGLAIMEMSNIFLNVSPDVVVTVADRYETLATSIAAAYMNIPLAHVQGGEVTGSIDEKVRHANTKIADLHLVASEYARKRVIQMGEREGSVYVTGCPSIDLARLVSDRTPNLDFDPLGLYGGVGADIDFTEPYLIVMQHPITTQYEQARFQVEETLEAIRKIDIQTLWFWPNSDAGSDGTSKGIRSFREQYKNHKIRFFKNMSPEHFLTILNRAETIVGNSSVAIRECAYLGVPAVNIGDRQAGRDRGKNVVNSDHAADEIYELIKVQIAQKGKLEQDLLYGDGTAGQKIADVIAMHEFTTEKMLTY